MKKLSFDFETFLPRAGLAAPRPVCASFCWEGEDPFLLHAKYDRDELGEFMADALDDPDVRIVGHYLAYDFTVLAAHWPELIPAILRAFDTPGKITDTFVRRKLILLAQGRFRFDWKNGNAKPYFSLEAAAREHLGLDLTKAGGPRTRYHEVYDLELTEWPDDFLMYALTDAAIPLQVWDEQAKYYDEYAFQAYVQDDGMVVDEARQIQKTLSLKWAEAWGLRTDAERVAALKKSLQEDIDYGLSVLQSCDPYIYRSSGTRNMTHLRYHILQALGDDVPLTDKGLEYQEKGALRSLEDQQLMLQKKEWKAYKKQLKAEGKGIREAYTSTSMEVVEDAAEASGSKPLKVYAEVQQSFDEMSKFLPLLEAGTQFPINTYYNFLVVTGRTSSRNPNLQNLPRHPGVRECIVPRPGYYFAFADYDSLEVRTWAQACLDIIGWSTAAENYQKDPDWDPHSYMAVAIAHSEGETWVTYEWMLENKKIDPRAKKWRQMSKGPDFGLPGGMGAETLIDYCKGYGVSLALDEAQVLKDLWYETFPEANDYFAVVSEITNSHKTCVQLVCHRQRGDCSYTELANSFFQGLAGDVTADAMWQITKECHDPDSPLYGSRLVLFVHDEFGLEVPIETSHEAAVRLQEIMVEAGKKWCPDVPLRTEAGLATRWYKEVPAVHDDNGRLVPFDLEGGE